MDITKINKAIINEDLAFFKNNNLKPLFKKVAFSSAVRTGRVFMIKGLIELDYWHEPDPSVLRHFFQIYDRPDIVDIFVQKNVDLSYCGDEYIKLASENNNLKTVDYFVSNLPISFSALLTVFENIVLKVRNIHDFNDVYNTYIKIKEELVKTDHKDSINEVMKQLPDKLKTLFFHGSLDKELSNNHISPAKMKI
jgi:hypothetical protein